MTIFPLSFFLENPEKLNYFNASELEKFTKKKSIWRKDPVREKFINRYCKSDNRTIKNAIARFMGYNGFAELNDQHKDIREKTIESINRNLYGLEFIRIALILLSSLDNKNMDSYLSNIHIHLKWGLDLLNRVIASKDTESTKERLLSTRIYQCTYLSCL